MNLPETDLKLWDISERAERSVPQSDVRREYRERVGDPAFGRSILERLSKLRNGIELNGIVGSCSCDIKSPDLRFHRATCRYRVFSELIAADNEAAAKMGKRA